MLESLIKLTWLADGGQEGSYREGLPLRLRLLTKSAFLKQRIGNDRAANAPSEYIAHDFHPENPNTLSSTLDFKTMTDILFDPFEEDAFSQTQPCRNHDQAWIKTTIQHELELDQLLTLLTDLLKNLHYRRLQQRALEHINAISQLKSRFQRLRLNVTCGLACLSVSDESCYKPRISPYTTMVIDSQLDLLAKSLDRSRTGCYQFLSRLVTLNLF